MDVKRRLSAEELAILELEIAAPENRGIHVELLAVRSYHRRKKRSYRLVGAEYCVNHATVRNWNYAYLESGKQGLFRKPGGGRPPKLKPEQARETAEKVDSSPPAEAGFRGGVWTARLVRRWIWTTFGIGLSLTSVRTLLRRGGLRRLRTRPSPPPLPLSVKSLFYRELGAFASAWGSDAAVLYLDEAHLSPAAQVTAVWCSEQRRTPDGRRLRRAGKTLIGAVDPLTGRLVSCVADRGDAEHFKLFLESLLAAQRAWGVKKTVIVLDNARIHKAKLLKVFLEEHKDEMRLFFLPPYAPELNVIERVWKQMRREVTKHYCADTVEERTAQYIEWASPLQRPNEKLKSICRIRNCA